MRSDIKAWLSLIDQEQTLHGHWTTIQKPVFHTPKVALRDVYKLGVSDTFNNNNNNRDTVNYYESH